MIRNFIITMLLLLFPFSIHSQKEGTVRLATIDIESGLENLTRLKTSDLGKTIRYIPLETSDDCLIGKNTIVKVLKNYIIVEHRASLNRPGSCLLFSKEDGRFICEIGHVGQDPEAFSDCFSYADEKEEFLYFEHKPDQLIKYDMKGNFCGKTTFPSSELATYYLISDSGFIGYFDGFNIWKKEYSDQYALGFFEKNGDLKATIPSFYPYTSPFSDIFQMNVINGTTMYSWCGSWTRAGAYFFEYTQAKHVRQINAIHAARIWKAGGDVRFKQDFVDTIYTVSGSKLLPFVAFHTGKHHWPVEERKSEKNNRERIFITDIYENNRFIFFQCVKGMFVRGSIVLYNGLYNKETGQTKLSEDKDIIEDDLTGFMPFKPWGMSTLGEYVSFVESWEIMDWLEKHPEAKKNKKLSFLENLNEDMNPVVILIE